MRKLSVAVLVGALVVALAVPAFAWVSKSGTAYCGTGQTPYSEGRSNGVTQHFPPGQGFKQFNLGTGSLKPSKAHSTGGNGGWWMVRSNLEMSSPGTSAGCDNFS